MFLPRPLGSHTPIPGDHMNHSDFICNVLNGVGRGAGQIASTSRKRLKRSVRCLTQSLTQGGRYLETQVSID